MLNQYDGISQHNGNIICCCNPCECIEMNPLLHKLYDNALHHSSSIAFKYNDGQGKYTTLSYIQLYRVIIYLTPYYKQQLQSSTNNYVALYGMSDVRYFITVCILFQLNYIPICISIRNSVSAIEYLINAADSNTMIHGSEPMLMYAVSQLISINNKYTIITSDQLNDAIQHVNNDITKNIGLSAPIQTSQPDINQPVLCMHTSGTTQAYPKLIQLPYRYLIEITTYKPVAHYTSNDIIYSIAPYFHALGFIAVVSNIISSACTVIPILRGFPPSNDNIVDNVIQSNANCMIMLPSIIEQLVAGKDEHIIKLLQSMKRIIYGGAALSNGTGDYLWSIGVKLCNGYGTTEAGYLMYNYLLLSGKPSKRSSGWNEMQILDEVKHRLILFDSNKQLYQFIVTSDHGMLALNGSNESDGSYNTHDLIQLVDQTDNMKSYVLYGRIDDIIVHSNGEKTNPTPIESDIKHHCNLIKQCVVLGQQQFNTALLVELHDVGLYNDADTIQHINTAITLANESAAQHSRLMDGMVYILNNNEVLPLTDKGTVKRNLCETMYQTQINQLYNNFNGTHAGANDIPNQTAYIPTQHTFDTQQQLCEYLLTQLQLLLHRIYNNTTTIDAANSLFDQGVDSLIAIQYYNQSIRSIASQYTQQCNTNILYQYNTINKVGEYIWALINGNTDTTQTNDNMQQAEQLYIKYELKLTSALSDVSRSFQQPPAQCVLLYGGSGTLGTWLLNDLLHNPSISKVYAVVRTDNTRSAIDKVRDNFTQRMINTDIIISSMEINKLIVLNDTNDFTKYFYEIVEVCTTVIQNAWKLNFNESTDSFDDTCISWTYRLIELCATKYIKSFHFISSISVGYQFPIGYTQSKLVSERLCSTANTLYHVPTSVYRVGQISGDTHTGQWNTTDSISMLIQSSQTVHCLPNQLMDVDYLPADIVSSSVVQTMLLRNTSYNDHGKKSYLTRIINSRTVPWMETLNILQSIGLQFDIVDPNVWLDRLRNVIDVKQVPALKLLDYFTTLYTIQDEQTQQHTPLSGMSDTSDTTTMPPVMEYDLNQQYWSKVIKYWCSQGFLQCSSGTKF